MTEDGTIELTLQDIYTAKSNGITEAQLRYRLWQGMTLERAVSQKLQEKKPFESEYLELAKKNGISYDVFIRRVRSSGWNELKAATEPVRPRKTRK